MYVYAIVENGECYPSAYSSYKNAVSAVKEKHKELIEMRISELVNYPDLIEEMMTDINVPETAVTSHLYIEKGINIFIHRLLVK